jgi:hypothetical protein
MRNLIFADLTFIVDAFQVSAKNKAGKGAFWTTLIGNNLTESGGKVGNISIPAKCPSSSILTVTLGTPSNKFACSEVKVENLQQQSFNVICTSAPTEIPAIGKIVRDTLNCYGHRHKY